MTLKYGIRNTLFILLAASRQTYPIYREVRFQLLFIKMMPGNWPGM